MTDLTKGGDEEETTLLLLRLLIYSNQRYEMDQKNADISNHTMGERNAQQRKRRAEMTDEQREENKRRQREYQRQYRARQKAQLQNNSTPAAINQIVPSSSLAERQIPELRNNHVHVQSNEEEFDRELFEPAHDGWDSDEDAMDGGHGLHNENLYDDDGVIHRHAQGHDYESYRVPPEGPAANSVTHDDPYDYIYQNLPERHKLRKVPDCSGRGARHLQLYFYDTEDEALSHRVKRSPDLDINIIRTILAILQDNPYVHTFRRNGDFPNLDEYKIELNTNVTPDQRSLSSVYNPQGETGWNKFMMYSEDPFTPPSRNRWASTNSANGRAEGTTGGNHADNNNEKSCGRRRQ
ncbi:unnamed protein product [Miscanthus lutarioriparius]|uniref:Uncharacterized protein n=1 Tax=Miscanthus lutarioriparius TaxID=422564 RepID=A0A811RGE0_9POAL|nr:unnamed protein product [Miscanthus lutarioriparius]